MKPNELQMTVDHQQWHRRKTCAAGPNYVADPDKAHDYDAESRLVPERLNRAWKLLESTALPCHCGSRPGFHAATDRGDTPHIYCSNARCGRIVVCEPRSIERGIEEWNKNEYA